MSYMMSLNEKRENYVMTHTERKAVLMLNVNDTLDEVKTFSKAVSWSVCSLMLGGMFISQNIAWTGYDNMNNDFSFRIDCDLKSETWGKKVLLYSSKTKLTFKTRRGSCNVSSKYFHPRLHEPYIFSVWHAEKACHVCCLFIRLMQRVLDV